MLAQNIIEEFISPIQSPPVSLSQKIPGVKGGDRDEMKLEAAKVVKMVELLRVLVERLLLLAQWIALLPQSDADGRYLARVMPAYVSEAVLPDFTLVLQAAQSYKGTGTQVAGHVNGVVTWLAQTARTTPATGGGGTVTPPATTVTRNTDVIKITTTTGEYPTEIDGLIQDAVILSSQDKDTWGVFAPIPANETGRVRFKITGLTKPASFGSLNVGFSEEAVRPAKATHNGSGEEARIGLDEATKIGLLVEAFVNREAHLFNMLHNVGWGWFEYLNNVEVGNGDIVEIAVQVGSYDYRLINAGSGVVLAGNFESFENSNTRDGSQPAHLHICGFEQGYSIAELELSRFGNILT